MKILLFGKNGQIGSELQRARLPGAEVVALGRSEVELSDRAGLSQVLSAYKPDIIVNAAAYTAVDRAESEKINVFKINHEAVGAMADYARDQGALLVHYSTDYVFDGEKPGAYVETDPPNPQNVYGRSKWVAEETILRSDCKALIFRTSWVFSPGGRNFIKTILELAKTRDVLDVVADQYGAPTAAEFIADLTWLAITAYDRGTLKDKIYHLTATGKTSWYELACYVLARARARGVALKLKPEKIRPVTTEAYGALAKRPKNSCLDTRVLSSALNISFPNWKMYVDPMVDTLIHTENVSS